MLTIKHFTKSYKGGKKAVNDLNLVVEKVTSTALSVITVQVKQRLSEQWSEF